MMQSLAGVTRLPLGGSDRGNTGMDGSGKWPGIRLHIIFVALAIAAKFWIIWILIAVTVVQLGLDSSLSHGIAIKQCNQTVEGPSQIRYGKNCDCPT